MRTPARSFGQVAGSAYLVLGILGFAVTGLDGFAASRGATLLGLEVNPLHNLLHVTLGLVLVVGAARGEGAARTLALLTAAASGVLGLIGLGLVGADGNVLALNTPDNLFHLVTAGTAAVAAGASTRRDPALRRSLTTPGRQEGR